MTLPMFACRPAYLRTAAVVASAVGFTTIGLNKAIAPRAFQQFSKTTGRNILIRGMATASTIKLDTELSPEYYVKGSREETAKLTSELLQENHDKHHIFFNADGFHDHIAHHLLTLYALNATPSEIKQAYTNNLSYQRRLTTANKTIVTAMHDPEKFASYLGKGKHYHDFLQYFREEIDSKGWETVLNDSLFKGDPRADDMLVRLFAGLLHPLIHLGFGVEFRQPAIIAEALAQAAVHDNYMAPFFLGGEKLARENATNNDDIPTITSLVSSARADPNISSSAHWSDGNKLRDGVLARCPDEIIALTAQYRIPSPSLLREKTAESLNAALGFTAAAQHPSHEVRFDFFYMHAVNASIFFTAFMDLDALSDASKIRMLEWKVRGDVAIYASRGAPRLLLDEVRGYEGREGRLMGWEELLGRVRVYEDDGHASKLLRAVRHGEGICGGWEGREGFELGGDMWLKVGNMVVDSLEAGGPTWVRSCGFEEAWEGVPRRGEKARI